MTTQTILEEPTTQQTQPAKNNLLGILRKYPISSYYILTFLISWGLVILIAGPTGFPASTEEQDLMIGMVVGGLGLGPIVAGLAMTAAVYGKSGLGDMWTRLAKWKVSPKWYGVSLLTAPLLVLFILVGLSLFSPEYFPGILATSDVLSLLLTGIGIGLFAGIFEEIGWMGFVIPEMRKKQSVLTTGLIVGFLWGAWHYITAYWGSGTDTGAFSWELFIPMMTFYVIVLPAYRILMVWVYDRTESLLVGILMHATLTGNVLFILMPLGISQLGLVIWYLIFGFFLLAISLAVILNERRLSSN